MSLPLSSIKTSFRRGYKRPETLWNSTLLLSSNSIPICIRFITSSEIDSPSDDLTASLIFFSKYEQFYLLSSSAMATINLNTSISEAE